MKPFRSNKARSIASFLGWLAAHKARTLLLGERSSDTIDKVDVSTAEHQRRINYFCKLNAPFQVSNAVTARQLSYFKTSGYSFDLHRIMAPMQDLAFTYLPGDIKHVPDVPTVVRSRPIGNHNQNSVLLPLNSRRLFEVYSDPMRFEDKQSCIVWRGEVHKEHRAQLLEATEMLPFCDMGASLTSIERCKRFVKHWMTPQEQMKCKYLFVIEGNDIASNIRWAMNANSLCLMRKPRYETWFAEGLLQAGVHYVQVADDFSDIEEKFTYYEQHPDQALAIIRNAQIYVRANLDMTDQYAMGRQVMRQYAFHSSQQVR